MRKLKRTPVLTREACVVTLLEAETAAVTEQTSDGGSLRQG